MREFRLSGSVRGARGNSRSYRDYHYSAASAASNSLPWLNQLQNQIETQHTAPSTTFETGERIERIEGILESFGKANSIKIERYFSLIREGLSSTESSDFEEAQVKLGKLLGFDARNSNAQGAPDPWWVLGSKGIVFEDYTATGDNPVISKDKILQAKGHPDFLKIQFHRIAFYPVLCTKSSKLDGAASPHVNGVY